MCLLIAHNFVDCYVAPALESEKSRVLVDEPSILKVYTSLNNWLIGVQVFSSYESVLFYLFVKSFITCLCRKNLKMLCHTWMDVAYILLVSVLMFRVYHISNIVGYSCYWTWYIKIQEWWVLEKQPWARFCRKY